jgi:hypothetical protein
MVYLFLLFFPQFFHFLFFLVCLYSIQPTHQKKMNDVQTSVVTVSSFQCLKKGFRSGFCDSNLSLRLLFEPAQESNMGKHPKLELCKSNPENRGMFFK